MVANIRSDILCLRRGDNRKIRTWKGELLILFEESSSGCSTWTPDCEFGDGSLILSASATVL